MFNYTLAKEYDIEMFEKYQAVLDAIPDIEKAPVLNDVDGGVYQRYVLNGKKVVLKLSAYVDAVYVESETDLEGIL